MVVARSPPRDTGAVLGQRQVVTRKPLLGSRWVSHWRKDPGLFQPFCCGCPAWVILSVKPQLLRA